MVRLPKIVHILDIETLKASRKKLLDSEIAFAGLKTYKKAAKGKYRSIGYKYFLPNQLKKLQDILENSLGVIVGHNLFDFDYRVLSKYINISPAIIKKSIDTLYFLYRKNGEDFRGCGLNELARINLNKAKTLDSRQVGKLWLEGHRTSVIKYNKNDCELTFKLYLQMLSKRYIYKRPYNEVGLTPIQVTRQTAKRLEITKDDLTFLRGENKMVSFEQWDSLVKTNSRLMVKKFPLPIRNLQKEVIKFSAYIIRIFAFKAIRDDFRLVNDKLVEKGVIRFEQQLQGGKWFSAHNVEEFLDPNAIDGICHIRFEQDRDIVIRKEKVYEGNNFVYKDVIRKFGRVYATRSVVSKALKLGLEVWYIRGYICCQGEQF